MKPLPTLMKPLRSVDLANGEEATALVERSDVAAVEALAVVAEAAVAWELAVLALDKFGEFRIEGDFRPLMTNLLYFKGLLEAPRALADNQPQ